MRAACSYLACPTELFRVFAGLTSGEFRPAGDFLGSV